MASGHPVDTLGRVLPHAGWPADRQAPGELELVRRFCNSVNRENGAERFPSPDGFDTWLASEGLAPVGPSTHELARVIGVREVLHELVVANATATADAHVWQRLADLMATARVGFTAGGSGLAATPQGDGVDAFLAQLGLTVAGSIHDGTWPRLKACRHCHWVVYDPSKNRSARWCSMSACGGRHNAREYRRRQSAR